MPAAPIGSVWGTGTWSDTAWEQGTWADVVAVAPFDFCETTVLSLMPARRVRSLMPDRSVESLMPTRRTPESCA